MSPLEEKSEAFADRIISLSDFYLDTDKRVKYSLQVMVKQITRSGTSIGANIAESTFAQSKNDLKNKLSVALKEANETRYWLRRLLGKGHMEVNAYESMCSDVNEIIYMLIASINTINNGEKN